VDSTLQRQDADMEVPMAIERRPDGTTRGGNAPADEVQDTPEQNAGYDAVVRGERPPQPVDEEGDAVQADRHEADRGKSALSDAVPDRPARRGAGN
jgi:hypothetical protein